MLQVQYEFTLLKGYMDEEGNLHKNGIIRLATAMDGVRAMRDPGVMQNPGYATIIILFHVIIKLGGLPLVTAEVIEKLFAFDLRLLQEMYEALSGLGGSMVRATHPYCGKEFITEMDFKG